MWRLQTAQLNKAILGHSTAWSTHKIMGSNKWLLFEAIKFWGGLLCNCGRSQCDFANISNVFSLLSFPIPTLGEVPCPHCQHQVNLGYQQGVQ